MKLATLSAIGLIAFSSLGFTAVMYQETSNANVVVSQASQQQPVSVYECTQVTLEDIDPSLLTKEERIALLDGSLSESIDNYSSCVGTIQSSAGAGAGKGMGGGAGGGDLQGNGSGSGSNSEETKPEQTTQSSSQNGTETQEELTPENQDPKQEQITPAKREVIAPKDNDKIICKLLFQEIQKVSDPDMLEGLKEQYSNYQCG